MKGIIAVCLVSLFTHAFFATCDKDTINVKKPLVVKPDSGTGGQEWKDNTILPPPDWMSKAVIYEIAPAYFVKNGTLDAITAKLPEIKKLGVNTIWLQPITVPVHYISQGYGVVNYMQVNPQLGTKEDLHQLINTAHSLRLRVILDMVLSHTSIKHPYAQDIIKNSKASKYYGYYQHKIGDKPYSRYLHSGPNEFVYYFWDGLVNLNYKNKKVRQWILNICKYWAKTFNIDGYRFDSMWAVNARRPSFGLRLRKALKNINPEFLLLCEGKGNNSRVYKLGYDAAYDWTSSREWISQPSWLYSYTSDPLKEFSIFNYPDVYQRGEMLVHALFEGGGTLLVFYALWSIMTFPALWLLIH